MTRNNAPAETAVFAALAVLALLAAAAPAAGQPAALTGAVLDPDGRPAPHATVIVSDRHAVGESVVVTAAGRELPRSRVTDSVTVVTGDDLAARQFETVAEAPGPFSVGDALLRRPRHQGSVDLSLTRPRFSVFTSIGTRSRTRDVDPSFGAYGGFFDNPGYALVDLGGRIRVSAGIELTARVLNLLDRGYEEALGFPGLGRSVIAGVRIGSR